MIYFYFYHHHLIVVPSFYHSYLLWIVTAAIWLLCFHFTTAIFYDFYLSYLLGLFATGISWAFWPQLFAGPFDHSYLLWHFTTVIWLLCLDFTSYLLCLSTTRIFVPSFYHSYLLWPFTTAIWLLYLHFTTAICYDVLPQLLDCCAFILPQLFTMTFLPQLSLVSLPYLVSFATFICCVFSPPLFPVSFITAICCPFLP